MKILAFLLIAISCFSQVKTTPWSEGYGVETLAGRGKQIISVTNTNDTGVGSYRAALETSGGKTIVFHVAGVIEADSSLDITDDSTTVLFSTAPGDGIAIHYDVINIDASHVFLQGARVRAGDRTLEQSSTNSNYESRNSIRTAGNTSDFIHIDHCSMSWSMAVNGITMQGSNDVTFSWCLFAEPLRFNLHEERAHSRNASIHASSQGRSSFVKNAFLFGNRRNPTLKGPGPEGAFYNFTYGHGDSIQGGGYEDGTSAIIWRREGPPIAGLDFVGNYIADQPNNGSGGFGIEFQEETGALGPGTSDNSVYFHDNYVGSGRTYEGSLVASDIFVSTRFTDLEITPFDPYSLEQILLSDDGVGALPIDSVDQAVRDSVKANGGSVVDCVTSDSLFSYETTVAAVTAGSVKFTDPLGLVTANNVDERYFVKITDVSSSASGQVRNIDSYNAADSTFQLATNWTTPPVVGDTIVRGCPCDSSSAYGKFPSTYVGNWGADTDSDGIPDKAEVRLGTDVNTADALGYDLHSDHTNVEMWAFKNMPSPPKWVRGKFLKKGKRGNKFYKSSAKRRYVTTF